jgi:hypothetical protein
VADSEEEEEETVAVADSEEEETVAVADSEKEEMVQFSRQIRTRNQKLTLYRRHSVLRRRWYRR